MIMKQVIITYDILYKVIMKCHIEQKDELSYDIIFYDDVLDKEVTDYALSLGANLNLIESNLSIKFTNIDSSILFKLSYINYER